MYVLKRFSATLLYSFPSVSLGLLANERYGGAKFLMKTAQLLRHPCMHTCRLCPNGRTDFELTFSDKLPDCMPN